MTKGLYFVCSTPFFYFFFQKRLVNKVLGSVHIICNGTRLRVYVTWIPLGKFIVSQLLFSRELVIGASFLFSFDLTLDLRQLFLGGIRDGYRVSSYEDPSLRSRRVILRWREGQF